MYTEHPSLRAPANQDAVIWRYVNFAKFVDMLDRNALHFSQLYALGDPWEGAPSVASLEELRRTNEEQRAQLIADGIISEDFQWPTSPGSIFQSFRLLMYVNCWHMSDYESLAMWELYSRDGVAIRSTFGRLAQCFAAVPEQVMIGQITYRDRRVAVPGEIAGDAFSAAFRKGMSFAHEQEVRAAWLGAPGVKTGVGYTQEELMERGKLGIDIGPIDLDVLIDAIFVAPRRPEWFRELVGRVMAKYGLDKPLVNSELDERPDLT